MQHCQDHGGKLWLYAGSVQTLEYNLLRELKRGQTDADDPVSNRQWPVRARKILKAFAQDKHWLAALAEEGNGENYNSHNTTRLDVAGMKALLLKLDFMQRIARGEHATAED